jgi:hypothetical protein
MIGGWVDLFKTEELKQLASALGTESPEDRN